METIVPLDKKFINSVSLIHEKCINNGMLSFLGIEILNYFYANIIKCKKSFGFVALRDNLVIGFICATEDINILHKKFLMKNFFRVFIISIPKILSYRLIRGILQSLFYTKGNKKNPCMAELISVAVDEKYRNSGVAKTLLNKMENEFLKRNIKKYKVIVGVDLERALNYYKKNGFDSYRKITYNSKKMDAILFTKKII
jgi:ribosomal protein S18 acetylase RimI-like enzyme